MSENAPLPPVIETLIKLVVLAPTLVTAKIRLALAPTFNAPKSCDNGAMARVAPASTVAVTHDSALVLFAASRPRTHNWCVPTVRPDTVACTSSLGSLNAPSADVIAVHAP